MNTCKWMVGALLPVLILFLVGTACPSVDPDEGSVDNGRDFKAVISYPNESDVVTTVFFYDDFDAGSFSYYIDVDNGDGADYLVTCFAGEFTVKQESPGSSGSFGLLKYRGTPTVSGQQYRLRFPLSALELSMASPWELHYWFVEGIDGDRMPDSGYEILVNLM